jgi:hypothetical protein
MISENNDREGQMIEMKIAMCLNDTANKFMSEYHQVIEMIVIAYPNRPREEVTAMVDDFFREKRVAWEAQCLDTMRSEVKQKIEMIESSPIGALLDLLKELKR